MLSGLKVHHIGYLVKNMEKAMAQFETLGYSVINDKCYTETKQFGPLGRNKVREEATNYAIRKALELLS